MEDHVPRHAQMGAWVLINDRWYYALKKFIKPNQVIPIHYGTYPVINRTPAELKKALGDSSIEVLDVKPGQAVKF